MKKKFYLLAFILCIFTCGIILSACTQAPILEFKEGATLTKEYDGEEISNTDIYEIINVSDNQEVSITFYEGETEISAPKNVGNYKVVISIPNKTIEKDFEISTKVINSTFEFEYNGLNQYTKEYNDIFIDFEFKNKNAGADIESIELRGEASTNYALGTITPSIKPKKIVGDVVFPISPWVNLNKTRLYTKEIDASLGLITGDQATIQVTAENYDANAPRIVEIIGTDAANYSVSIEQIKIRVAIKVTITCNESTLNAYMIYGDNKLYKNSIGTLITQSDFITAFGAEVSEIKTSANTTLVEGSAISTLCPNAYYGNSNPLTDENGNSIIVNGKIADSINFTAILNSVE